METTTSGMKMDGSDKQRTTYKVFVAYMYNIIYLRCVCVYKYGTVFLIGPIEPGTRPVWAHLARVPDQFEPGPDPFGSNSDSVHF